VGCFVPLVDCFQAILPSEWRFRIHRGPSDW
jgi:hypothetical protein